jgi:hypothetical protein
VFSAVLDTCVLWPSLQRDFVLSMAVEGLYRPLWSEAILEELHRHEQVKWLDRAKDHDEARRRGDHLIEQIRAVFLQDPAVVRSAVGGLEPRISACRRGG